jgi:hypothetical protein
MLFFTASGSSIRGWSEPSMKFATSPAGQGPTTG